MTGEISLRGRVLPVGGIKEKILAAHRAGLSTVLIPLLNEKDLEDVPESVRNEIEVITIEHMSEVLSHAFDDDSLPSMLPDPPHHAEGAQIDQ
jgi:ATP-dependent Lon protease